MERTIIGILGLRLRHAAAPKGRTTPAIRTVYGERTTAIIVIVARLTRNPDVVIAHGRTKRGLIDD